MQKITTFLWFDDDAEEAMKFYVSLFKNSKILSTNRYPEGSPGKAGTLMTGSFQLEGQEFMALNGGPEFPFTEAISLFVNCESQQEVDDLWAKLTAGGGRSAAGSKTSSVSPGRSSPNSWARCWATRTLTRRSAPWTRCSR